MSLFLWIVSAINAVALVLNAAYAYNTRAVAKSVTRMALTVTRQMERQPDATAEIYVGDHPCETAIFTLDIPLPPGTYSRPPF